VVRNTLSLQDLSIQTQSGNRLHRFDGKLLAMYIKILFIVPTDAHYYKNHRMLKQFKIVTFAPTCFGPRRNHHQGAVL
jgi:hypothetical protein